MIGSLYHVIIFLTMHVPSHNTPDFDHRHKMVEILCLVEDSFALVLMFRRPVQAGSAFPFFILDTLNIFRMYLN